MYQLIQITKINDFLFCPYSVYLHSIYDSFTRDAYHRKAQKRGTHKHETVDKGTYSTSKHTLQGIALYSKKYKLVGKLDVFNTKTGHLIERKTMVKKIYDGYKYQLYAEKVCLEEAGYTVKKMSIHSLTDNKRHKIKLPDKEEMKKFENVLEQIWNLEIDSPPADISEEKCKHCIYSELCDYRK